MEKMEMNKGRSFETWKAMLLYTKDFSINNQSGKPFHASEYLQIEPIKNSKRRTLKSGTHGPKVAILRLIGRIANFYFRAEGLILKWKNTCHLSETEINSIDFLSKFAALEKNPEKKFVGMDQSVLDIWSSVDNSENNSDQIAREFIEKLFINHQDFRMISFKSISQFSFEAIAFEFLTFSKVNFEFSLNHRLFSVIREARGWTSESELPDRRNTIVRDFLWIRNSDKITETVAVDGFYHSAFDDYMYEVSATLEPAPAKESRNIRIVAKSIEDNESNHFYAFFPWQNSPRQLCVHDGIIAGTGSNSKQLAAWKTLVLEPNWKFCDELSIFIDYFHEIGNWSSINSLLKTAKVSKILSSGDTPCCRDAFRQLSFGRQSSSILDYALGGQIRYTLTEKFTALIEKELNNRGSLFSSSENYDVNASDIAGSFVMVIDQEISQRWHLIEPAQIITFLKSTNSSRESRSSGEFIAMIDLLLTN